MNQNFFIFSWQTRPVLFIFKKEWAKCEKELNWICCLFNLMRIYGFKNWAWGLSKDFWIKIFKVYKETGQWDSKKSFGKAWSTPRCLAVKESLLNPLNGSMPPEIRKTRLPLTTISLKVSELLSLNLLKASSPGSSGNGPEILPSKEVIEPLFSFNAYRFGHGRLFGPQWKRIEKRLFVRAYHQTRVQKCL